jgi:hypothetical protein
MITLDFPNLRIIIFMIISYFLANLHEEGLIMNELEGIKDFNLSDSP